MEKPEKKVIVKAALFVLFLVAAFLVLRNPVVQTYVSKGAIEQLLTEAGWFGPVLYMGIYAIGVSMLLPATIFTAVGAILFGPVWGTIYTILGATLGAASAFWIARTLGHDFAQHLVGNRMKKYREKMVEHGFATIFYLRMIFFPFTVLNFGAGLTKIRFNEYMLGTFLGIIPGTFIITFFIATVADAFFMYGAFSEQFLMELLTPKVLFAVALFIVSFFIPRLVKKIGQHVSWLRDRKT